MNPENYKRFGLSGHSGIDLVPLTDDWRIRALEAGKVVRYVELHPTLGNYLVLWNAETRRGWWMAHLACIALRLGQSVEADEVIGKMGNTGNSTGPHLHLGLRLTDANGYAINTSNSMKGFEDPLPFLKAER